MMNDSSADEVTTISSDTDEDDGKLDLFEYLRGPLIIITIIVVVSLILFFMYIYKYRSPVSRRPSMAQPALAWPTTVWRQCFSLNVKPQTSECWSHTFLYMTFELHDNDHHELIINFITLLTYPNWRGRKYGYPQEPSSRLYLDSRHLRN